MAQPTIASFSMEFGLLLDEKRGLATPHAGGLGVLEGDNFLTARDRRQKYIAISLLHRNGYVRQEIQNGEQVNLPDNFEASQFVRRKETATVNINHADKIISAYEYTDGTATLLYLSDDVMDPYLYGNHNHKLDKSIILGIGGVRMLR